MAGTNRFYRGNDGTWSAGNFNTARDGGGSTGLPVDGDLVYIEKLNHPLVSSIDQSAIDLAELTITTTDGGRVGGAGNPLKIGVSYVGATRNFYYENLGGGGNCYYHGGTPGCDVLKIFNMRGAEFVLEGGTASNVDVYEGDGLLRVKGAATVGGVEIGGHGMIVESPTSGGDLTTLSMYAPVKVLIADRDATLAVVDEGVLTLTGTANASSSVTLKWGGVLRHLSSGTLNYVYVYPGGVADATSNPYPFTVTDSDLWKGGRLFSQASALITYQNATTLHGFRQK